ncbi:hypothetical protein HDV05_004104 [Chytridiales sp. JEL 0842]|nr:hypothetical protein HDV05_004104 [Chytridiales sp. JEL 0842]
MHFLKLSVAALAALTSTIISSTVSALPLSDSTTKVAAAAPISFTLPLPSKISAKAQVYLQPNSTASTIHILAVGTTFSSTDYDAYGKSAASNGIIEVILDYQSGSPFKGDDKYPPALSGTLQALASQASTWVSKYGLQSAPKTSPSEIYLGGHSAGGRATYGYLKAQGGAAEYKGVVSWDPVDTTSPFPEYALEKPHFILHPVESGCTGQISKANNGEAYFEASRSTAPTLLIQYTHPSVHHNTITSSGTLGNLVCSGKVKGFHEDLGAKVGKIVKDAEQVLSQQQGDYGLPGNGEGVLSFVVKRK